MKLAFSTLGCPRWDMGEILATAKDFGYDGVELRGVQGELHMTRLKSFQPENIAATRRQFEDKGVAFACVTSGCVLSDADHGEETREEIRQYVDAARALGAPYVRVMGDGQAGPGPHHVDDYLVEEMARDLAAYAGGKGITLLVETNGAYADSNRLAKLLDSINSPAVQALWDINHPYRFFDEAPERTVKNLAGRIRHVHLKDSVVANGRLSYRMLGNGDLPVKEGVRLLEQEGYQGFYSLEWLKRYDVTLEDPGIAFLQYVEFMRAL